MKRLLAAILAILGLALTLFKFGQKSKENQINENIIDDIEETKKRREERANISIDAKRKRLLGKLKTKN